MNRRKFLGTVALGAGATALPVWLSRAFRLDETRCSEPVDLGEIEAQMTDPDRCLPGNEHGAIKPQLVLIIPTDISAQYLRGHAFGELLNHGSDEQLAPLACFDVVCRRLGDLDPAWREGQSHEPLMILIERDGTRLTIDGTLPEVPPADRHLGFNHTKEDPVIDARIALLAELVARAADDPRLVGQACSERASLAPRDLARLDQLPHSLGELQPADVDRAAATTTLVARSADHETREHLTALLAAAVRARLCERRIDGAPWARSGGCGVTVEGETSDRHVSCGMGHTPARSQRFLKFFVDNY